MNKASDDNGRIIFDGITLDARFKGLLDYLAQKGITTREAIRNTALTSFVSSRPYTSVYEEVTFQRDLRDLRILTAEPAAQAAEKTVWDDAIGKKIPVSSLFPDRAVTASLSKAGVETLYDLFRHPEKAFKQSPAHAEECYEAVTTLRSLTILSLGLIKTGANILLRNGITSIGQLILTGDEYLSLLPGMQPNLMNDIRYALKNLRGVLVHYRKISGWEPKVPVKPDTPDQPMGTPPVTKAAGPSEANYRAFLAKQRNPYADDYVKMLRDLESPGANIGIGKRRLFSESVPESREAMEYIRKSLPGTKWNTDKARSILNNFDEFLKTLSEEKPKPQGQAGNSVTITDNEMEKTIRTALEELYKDHPNGVTASEISHKINDWKNLPPAKISEILDNAAWAWKEWDPKIANYRYTIAISEKTGAAPEPAPLSPETIEQIRRELENLCIKYPHAVFANRITPKIPGVTAHSQIIAVLDKADWAKKNDDGSYTYIPTESQQPFEINEDTINIIKSVLQKLTKQFPLGVSVSMIARAVKGNPTPEQIRQVLEKAEWAKEVGSGTYLYDPDRPDAQPRWNKFEAAILLDAYLQVCEHPDQRKFYIQQVSEQLRQMALSQDMQISDTYRNINGITMKMLEMESAWLGNQDNHFASTKLYDEITALYRSDPNEFNRILTRAKIMCRKPEEFWNWLEPKVSPAFLTELYHISLDLDAFIRENLSSGETVYSLMLKLPYEAVGQELFALPELRKKYNEYNLKLIQKYLEFLRDYLYPEVSKPDSPDPVRTVDLNNPADLRNTVPLSLQFFKDRILDPKNWDMLYVRFLSLFTAVYPGFLRHGLRLSPQDESIDIYDLKNPVTITNLRNIPKTYLFARIGLEPNEYIAKIKYLLDQKGILYSCLTITYKNTETGNNDSQSPIPVFPDTFEDPVTKEAFREYLGKHGVATLPNQVFYCYCLETAAGSIHESLFGNSHAHCCDVCIKLSSEGVIDSMNASTKQALTLFEAFLRDFEILLNDKEKLSKYRTILQKQFSGVYKLNSFIQRKLFKDTWQEHFGEAIEDDDDQIDQTIKTMGIIENNMVFLPEAIMDKDQQEQLMQYLEKRLANGFTAVHYQVIFNDLSEMLVKTQISTTNLLKKYLELSGKKDWRSGDFYLLLDPSVPFTPSSQIEGYLQEHGMPDTYPHICQMNSNIPADDIKLYLQQNPDILYNAGDSWFAAGIIDLSAAEWKQIRNLISKHLEIEDYLLISDLYKELPKILPAVADQVMVLSAYGLQNLLKRKLSNAFSFKGNVISTYAHPLDMIGIYRSFAQRNAPFKYEDLKKLSQDLEIQIYYDSVFAGAIRINSTDYARKDSVRFDIEKTDAVLEQFCTGKYLPLREITAFTMFPSAGVPWNTFLLEQYVYQYSKKFCLCHSGFSADSCAGAVVRRSAGIFDFKKGFIPLVLAESSVDLTKKDALNFLLSKGYILSKGLDLSEEILQKAKTIRKSMTADSDAD